jgi:3-oxoacyl-[acyl-carrier protein] reductase
MDLRLRGRTGAVAAASSGLGYASAAALVAEGVRVVVCGRDRQRIEDAAARLEAVGGPGSAVALVADVSRPAGATAFVAGAMETLGTVDILVPNAGGPPPGTFASTGVDAYADALDLNLMSVVAMCKAAIPAMQERRWGRVVAITSISVRQPIGTLILSNTARTGATGFLKTVAREVAGDGVTVNSLQPGIHATDRMTALHGGDVSAAARDIPAGIVGDPADFGMVVAFLCSEHARFITGAALNVDGGAYAGLQ